MPSTQLEKKFRDYASKNKVAPLFEQQPYNQSTWSEQLETLIVGTTTTTYGSFGLPTGESCLAVLNDFENGTACIKTYNIVFNPNDSTFFVIFTTQSKTSILP